MNNFAAKWAVWALESIRMAPRGVLRGLNPPCLAHGVLKALGDTLEQYTGLWIFRLLRVVRGELGVVGRRIDFLKRVFA